MCTIEKIGRRHYLRNLPFSSKDIAKSRGANWDPAERCWWTGKADVANEIVAASDACPACSHKPDYCGSGDYDDCRVCGRAYREV